MLNRKAVIAEKKLIYLVENVVFTRVLTIVRVLEGRVNINEAFFSTSWLPSFASKVILLLDDVSPEISSAVENERESSAF